MVEHTVQNDLFDAAPARRVLRGDKRNPEKGTHIIEFPGGAVELARLGDGSYWVHISVNRQHVIDGTKGLRAAIGRVVDSRVDWEGRGARDIPGLPDGEALTQIAVRIMPEEVR